MQPGITVHEKTILSFNFVTSILYWKLQLSPEITEIYALTLYINKISLCKSLQKTKERLKLLRAVFIFINLGVIAISKKWVFLDHE